MKYMEVMVMQKSKSTLIFSPEEQNLGLIDVTARCIIGAEALVCVSAGFLPTPQFTFAFSVICIYGVMTAMVGLDPVYWLLQIRSVPTPVVRAKQQFWRRFLDYQGSGSAQKGAIVDSELAGHPGW